LLLGTKQYADAVTAFTLQLERSRQKSRALLGLSEAQAGLGNTAEAEFTRQKLDRIRAAADPPVKPID